jgi:hypothetical protein
VDVKFLRVNPDGTYARPIDGDMARPRPRPVSGERNESNGLQEVS